MEQASARRGVTLALSWMLAQCGGTGPTAPGSDLPAGASDCAAALRTGGPSSQWVFAEPGGGLAYRTLQSGDRIMDFSHAGYMGGGVAIPTVPVEATVEPSGTDDTDDIQAALEGISRRPLVGGFRGAVLLQPGTYTVSRTLRIAASGVVLRGSGVDTVLNAVGEPRVFLQIQGTGTWITGTSVAITDGYVPAGARSVHVPGAFVFETGDTVVVERPVTSAWVSFMGMDMLVRNGAPQTWLGTNTVIRADRIVAGISGDEVTLDVPLSDSLDARYLNPPGARLSKYRFNGRIAQVGLEALRIVAPPRFVPISEPTFSFLDMSAVVDGWVKDVVAQDFSAGLSTSSTAKRLTLQNVILAHSARTDASAGSPADFAIQGSQILLNGCASQGSAGAYYVVTESTSTGPNVVLDFTGRGGLGIQPRQRWATGLLVDGARLSTGNIEYMSRGNSGSGQGWTMGWGVVWNSQGASLTVQAPPGSTNWAIGSKGTIVDRNHPGLGGPNLPRGTFDSAGTAVDPRSLYLAQLCDRLGRQALENTGY